MEMVNIFIDRDHPDFPAASLPVRRAPRQSANRMRTYLAGTTPAAEWSYIFFASGAEHNRPAVRTPDCLGACQNMPRFVADLSITFPEPTEPSRRSVRAVFGLCARLVLLPPWLSLMLRSNAVP